MTTRRVRNVAFKAEKLSAICSVLYPLATVNNKSTDRFHA